MYVHRPVGNRPEWMPLDNSLNNDIQMSLSLHCAITAHLEDDDICKFSFRTPSTIVSDVQRIYNNPTGSNVPSCYVDIIKCNRYALDLHKNLQKKITNFVKSRSSVFL